MTIVRETALAPSVDVAIVGAGPAGLAAAEAATATGANVIVIDSAEQPGGQFWRHRSEAAGIVDTGALHHGWSEYLALRAAFDAGLAAGVIRYLPATSVWMVSRSGAADLPFVLRLAPAHGGGHSPTPTVRAAKLVIATGGYDRQLPVPGWQLPGVMAAGGIQAFVKQNGMLPGRRFVVAGTGPFLLPVAHNIVQSGGSVAAVCESADLSGWIPRAHRAAGVPSKALEGAQYVGAFLKHRIPYRTRTVVSEILGDRKVEAVRTVKVRRDSSIVPDSERVIEGVDAVGLGWGFTPQLELPVQLGAATRQDVDGSLICPVDDVQRAFASDPAAADARTIPGLFLAGELTGVGGAVLAVLEGRVAGRTAGAEAASKRAGAGAKAGAGADGSSSATPAERRAIARQRGFADAMHRAHPVPAGWQDRLHTDTVVCRCEEVSAGELASARDDLAAEDLRTEKGMTRAGMGWCQGRVCGFAVSCLASGSSPTADSLAQSAKRPLAQPIPLGTLRDLGEARL